MKNRVDKQQVAENVNKIRQTKTEDVLVQLQKGSNAITDAVAAAIGTEATVLQLSQQVALDVRDMDLDTTEVEVQKALAEYDGVSVEALTVKAMSPAYGDRQMAIVTITKHQEWQGKDRMGYSQSTRKGHDSCICPPLFCNTAEDLPYNT